MTLVSGPHHAGERLLGVAPWRVRLPPPTSGDAAAGPARQLVASTDGSLTGRRTRSGISDGEVGGDESAPPHRASAALAMNRRGIRDSLWTPELQAGRSQRIGELHARLRRRTRRAGSCVPRV